MDTDTLNSNAPSDKTVNRKNFLLAATGAAAYLGMTGRAKASGTQAYLDSVETFSANHTFGNITAGVPTATGYTFFQSGYPWVDVKAPAYGALGDGSTNDAPAINAAIAAAITSAGTNGTGNAIVYFPPGTYVLKPTTSPFMSGSLLPPNSASNYTLLGAGLASSTIQWEGTAGYSMLKLINARGVTIRKLGFLASPTNAPSYGIEINRGAGIVGTANPVEVVVEDCYLGGGGNAPAAMGVAIGYTADSGQDTIPSGYGTFRHVVIENVGTAYKFGTAQAYGNNIIGGTITGGVNAGVPYTTAIDNTPASGSSYGGSYSMFGTSFGTNAMVFNVGQTNGYSINVFSLQTESDYQLMTTGATAIGPQTVQFFGGFTKFLEVPSDTPSSSHYSTILFNSTGGQLEFHGTEISGDSTCRWNYPGSAAIAHYGGYLNTRQWLFNGPLQLHGMYEVGPGDQPANITNLGSGTLQEFGHSGTLAGIGLGGATLSNVPGAAAGSTASVTLTGTDMAGLLTLIPNGSGIAAGKLIQINFAIPYHVTPTVVLMGSEPHSVGVISSIYTQPNGVGSFFVYTTTALTAGTQYQWNYLVIG